MKSADRLRFPPARPKRLPILLERAHIDLVRPRAAVLVRDVPEGLGDRRRLEHVLILDLREPLADERHVDCPVYIDVGDVDSLRLKIARHYLSQSPHRKLRRPKRRRSRKWFNPRSRASNDDHARTLREHCRDHLLSTQKGAEGCYPP